MGRDEEQPYSMREMRRLLEAPLRRPWLVVIPLVASLVAAVAVSFLLAPRYRASTLILVKPARVPSEFVAKMTTESIGRRLQSVRQEVKSQYFLEMVARELDPYRNLTREAISHITERMRDHVRVSVKGKDFFSIEFEHTDPKMAMLVAARLTELYMEEIVGQRERQVSDAYQFIEDQLQEAREELELKEKALTDFKRRHMGTLPEQVTSNLATLQRLQVEHQTVADSLRQATDTLLLLESGLGPGDSGRGAARSRGRSADPLAMLRAQLREALTRYTPEHPDVVTLKARIANLEKEVQAAARAEPGDDAVILDPAEAQARAQVVKARNEVERLKTRLAEVESRIASFQARVEVAPQREQEILSLTRDYQKLGENYAELLSKKLDAEMAAKLELLSKNDQFKILENAREPDSPSFPNHWLFALAGAVGGLLLGMSLTVVVDFLDPTIKDVEDLQSALPYPVVAVMPYVKPKDARRLAAVSEPPGREPDATIPAGRGRGKAAPRRTVPFRPRLRGGKGR